MSVLTFISSGPITSPPALTSGLGHLSAGKFEQAAKGRGWPGSTLVTVSSTLVAVIGRAVYGKSRRGVAARSELRAFDPTKEVGAMDPMGYWDPLHIMREGFKNPSGAYKSVETFNWYRAAELKHGRIAMLAAIGLPASTLGGSVDGGFSALSSEAGGPGMGIGILIAGILELYLFKQDPSKRPGDFGFDPCRLGEPHPSLRFPAMSSEEHLADMRLKELNHGRLAMCGVITSLWIEYGGTSTLDQFKGLASPAAYVPVLFLLFVAIFWQGDQRFYVADDAGTAPAYLSEGAPAPRLQEAASSSA